MLCIGGKGLVRPGLFSSTSDAILCINKVIDEVVDDLGDGALGNFELRDIKAHH